MNKILVISSNQALKNLLTNQQEFEFIFIDDQTKIDQFDGDLQKEIALLILDQEASFESKVINFALSKNLPIISLSENQDNLLGIKNLTHLPKPIRIPELLAIIIKIITNQESKIVNYKNCQINFQTRIVAKNQNEVKLTELESNLLKYLITHSDNLSKNDILTEVWHYKNLENINDTGIVEVTINKLRKKLRALSDIDLLGPIQL
jgi:DNA-binding response OmpR family regulator